MASVDASLYRYYKGPQLLLPIVLDTAIDAVRQFKYRDDDVLVASYPKSGTHWLNEIIQLMIHEGDPHKLDYRHRRVCLELTDPPPNAVSEFYLRKPSVELADTDPSPRVLTTHLTPGYLSEETWEKKVPIIYVFRDPRDVCLSFYNFLKQFCWRENEPVFKWNDVKHFLSDFTKGIVPFSGWCEHALSYEDYWKRGERILFVTYEDMKKDLPSVIKAIAQHIGRQVSDEVVDAVVAYSTVEAMRNNYKAAEQTEEKGEVNITMFVQTGVSGKWKTELPEDEWREMTEMFKEKVKDSAFAKKYFA